MRKHDGSVVKLKIESLILAPLMMQQNEGPYYTSLFRFLLHVDTNDVIVILYLFEHINILCNMHNRSHLPARHCESSDSDEGIKGFVFCFLGIVQCRTSFEITLNSCP